MAYNKLNLFNEDMANIIHSQTFNDAQTWQRAIVNICMSSTLALAWRTSSAVPRNKGAQPPWIDRASGASLN